MAFLKSVRFTRQMLFIGALLSGFSLWLYLPPFPPKTSLSQVTFVDYLPNWNYNSVLFTHVNPTPPVKTILSWNYAHRIEMAAFGLGQAPFIEKCPVKDCFLTNNQSYVPVYEFDAILVNIPVLWVGKLPPVRSTHQRLVFFTQESPVYEIENLDKHKGYFNWTMSYRTDSDIPYLYGRIEPLSSTLFLQEQPSWPLLSDVHWKNVSSIYKLPKRKLVAWFVSHCETDSRREAYVKELQRFIPVDVYGKCGTLQCDWDSAGAVSQPNCYEMLEQDYKFYLSFENSLCTEYVTEKFFAVMKSYVVPVVLGGANYSAVAPPHSYINAMEFTPQDLASYLRLLSENDALYGEFFWWKGYYTVQTGYEAMSREAFCHLCAKLHAREPPKVYEDLNAQWNPAIQCKRYQF